MILGIAGPAGAGKDTVADYLVSQHGFVKLAFAGPLKEMLAAAGFPEPADRDDKEKQLFGFNFTWRQAAQQLGTEWGRALDRNIWVKIVSQRAIECIGRGQNVVLSDVRFENEAVLIRGPLEGAILHLVGRQADIGDAASHVSESGVAFDPRSDFRINNSGHLELLYEQVDMALREQGFHA